jgi:hypothetical protein
VTTSADHDDDQTTPTTQPTTTTKPDDDDHDDHDDHDDDDDHPDDETTTTGYETTTTTESAQWVLGTYTAVGGTAGVEFSTDDARVAFTSPNAGYETEVEHEGDGVILIFFKSDAHDSLIRVSWDDGWKVTITEADDF